MDKDLEKLSALYDGELSSKEMQESLVEMNEDEDLKNTFQKFGLISDLVQRHSEQKTTKVFFLQDYLSKINPLMSNLVTAAATVMITLIILYQFDENRFKVDKNSSLQLSSALSSEQAKDQLLNTDQNIMEHMIHIMQSN
ncbi:MAG: RseA family anti-sigma factor, partial [Gammaproteobacteria bacterium]